MRQSAADIVARLDKSHAPLSVGQQRLWFIHQLEEGSTHYNILFRLEFGETVDEQALTRAVQRVIARHEVLRTQYRQVDNELIQVIANEFDVPLRTVDLTSLDESEREKEWQRLSRDEVQRPFDLDSDLMLRGLLVKLWDDDARVIFTQHHIASDGESIRVLKSELNELYNEFRGGRTARLNPVLVQYADYAIRQRNWLQSNALESYSDYWQTQLAGIPTLHNLQLDSIRPPLRSFEGQVYRQQISPSLSTSIKTFAQQQDMTVFMVLQTAFSILISRYSGEQDIVMGSPTSGRQSQDFEEVVGSFINTLVLRSKIDPEQTLLSQLGCNKKMLLDAYHHQQIPFEYLIEKLQPTRTISHDPIFQIMFNFLEMGDSSVEPKDDHSGRGWSLGMEKYDLTLTAIETPDQIELEWSIDKCIFSKSTVERWHKSMLRLLENIPGSVHQSVGELAILDKDEIQSLLYQQKDIGIQNLQNTCVHDLFEQQVRLNPSKIAVVFNDQKLSYKALNERANQLARYLIEHHDVTRDTLIGLCVDRSMEMVIGLLAILKAGGAYVPLDPSYPAARIAYMLEDAKLSLVLTQSGTQDCLHGFAGVLLELDDVYVETGVDTKFGHYSTQDLVLNDQSLIGQNLAYVIYTSGSTGQPKGVMVEHRNLVNFLASMSLQPGISNDDSLLAVTSTSFDIHGLEVFLPLAIGACLVVAPQRATSDPMELLKLMDQNNISIMQATPATWKMLLDSGWRQPTKLKVLCGGEALGQNLADEMLTLDNIELWNLYGPTETTIWSTAKQILAGDEQVLIGQPIDNTQIYILSNNLKLAPIAVAGELHIGGLGLARGYLNHPSLTAEKFIINPHYDKTNPASSERLYKTGDLACWLPDGNLKLLGRIDHQVKIRGFRIELGEIENLLNTHTDVNDVVVVAKESATTGDKHLVAYVVTEVTEQHDEDELSALERHELIEDLHEYVSDGLPAYMVPAAFVLMEQLPLTPNGKVDRNALPEPDFSTQQDVYLAPRTETEEILCDVWQEVLGVNKIGINDNFFHLGGHSLLVMSLVVKIKKSGFSIQPKDVFLAPTIGELSKIIEQAPISIALDDSFPDAGVIPLTPWQRGLLIKYDGNSINENIIRNRRELNFSVNPETLSLAFNHVVLKHEALRLQVNRSGSAFSGEINEHSNNVEIDLIDLSGFDADEEGKIVSEFLKKGNYVDIFAGQPIRVALFKRGHEKLDHLLITVNHFICDLYSLSIICEDLVAAYKQIESGQKITLPKISASAIFAANQIDSFCKSKTLKDELPYWASLPLSSVAALRPDYPNVQKADVNSGQRFIWKNISKEQTQYLVDHLSEFEGTTIADVLTVLAIEAQKKCLGGEYFRVNVLNNGRSILEDEFYIDLSRAVGYYNLTKLFILKSSGIENGLEALREMLDRIKAVPTKGVGLRYLLNGDDVGVSEKLEPLKAYLQTPNVLMIQYLGEVGGNDVMRVTPDDDRQIGNIYSIRMEAQILNGSLQFRWSYNENVYTKETMDHMVSGADNLMQKILRQLEV